MSPRSVFLRLLPLRACIVASSTCLAVVQASTQASQKFNKSLRTTTGDHLEVAASSVPSGALSIGATSMDITDDTWTNGVCPYLENNNTPLHEVFDSLLHDGATPEWAATPEEYRPLVLPGRARGPLAEQMRTELAAFLGESSWESRLSSTRRRGQIRLTDRVTEAANKFAVHLMQKSR
ncbi:unnamed protein product [Amoebophrya sp. A120]|nr:unnamed protein product [Amoebophrya sp. A120]|eukprot:GSA120T00020420001.1